MINFVKITKALLKIENLLQKLLPIDEYEETFKQRETYYNDVFTPNYSLAYGYFSVIEDELLSTRTRIMEDLNDIAFLIIEKHYFNKEELIDILKNTTTAKETLGPLLKDKVFFKNIIKDIRQINETNIFIHQATGILTSVIPTIVSILAEKESESFTVIKTNQFIIDKILISSSNIERLQNDLKHLSSANGDEYQYQIDKHPLSEFFNFFESYKEKLIEFYYNGKKNKIPLVVTNNEEMNVLIDVDFYKTLEIIEVIIFNAAEELCNAIEDGAIEQGSGMISISTSKELDRLLSKEIVIISISDNGRGVKNVDKIFDLNYSTKKSRGGSGLGLAAAKKIADDVGIIIKVEQGEESGTVFHLKIPYNSSVYKKKKLSSLNFNNKEHLKLAIYSDCENEEQTAINNLARDGFTLERIESANQFQAVFEKCSVLLVSIKNEERFHEMLEIIRTKKTGQMVLLCIDKNEGELLEKAIISRVDEIVFKPHDFYTISKKIRRYYRSFYLNKEIYKIKGLEKEALSLEYKSFVKDKASAFEEIALFYRELIVGNSDEFLHSIIASLKSCEIIYDDEKIIAQTIMGYITEIFKQFDFNKTLAEIENLSLYILHRVVNCRAEDVIYEQVFNKLIHLMKHGNNITPFNEGHADTIAIVMEFEKRLLGVSLKYLIQNSLAQKEKELNTNSLHFLMTSISHIQNNMLSLVEAKCSMLDLFIKLDLNRDDEEANIKKEKVIEKIKRRQFPLKEYLLFVRQTSNLFCSFSVTNEHCNIQNIDFLKFLLELVFINGNHIKNPGITMRVNCELSINETSIKRIQLHENILIASIYAIVENAIEAGAKNIEINIVDIRNQYIEINIINDGKRIEEELVPHLFAAHFTTKKQLGLGLTIAKKWLNAIYYNINYKRTYRDVSFAISIPFAEVIECKK